MNPIERAVSIHPYFNVHPGRMAEVKALFREFVDRAAKEDKVLYYEFTLNGEQVFCREAYVGAEGVLAHLKNVGDVLDKFLKIADLVRLEVHGPAEELEPLKGPMGALKPAWFVYEHGLTRPQTT